MEVGKKIIDDIKDSLRQDGPNLDVKRTKDGRISAVTVASPAPFCGAPSSVSMSFGKDGKVSVSAKDGFINPMAAGSNEAHEPTKGQLTWLKESIQKSSKFSEVEKAALSIQLDALIQAAPDKAPEIRRPQAPIQDYIDDPSRIRKLQGQEEVHYAEMQVFPDISAKKHG